MSSNESTNGGWKPKFAATSDNFYNDGSLRRAAVVPPNYP